MRTPWWRPAFPLWTATGLCCLSILSPLTGLAAAKSARRAEVFGATGLLQNRATYRGVGMSTMPMPSRASSRHPLPPLPPPDYCAQSKRTTDVAVTCWIKHIAPGDCFDPGTDRKEHCQEPYHAMGENPIPAPSRDPNMAGGPKKIMHNKIKLTKKEKTRTVPSDRRTRSGSGVLQE